VLLPALGAAVALGTKFTLYSFDPFLRYRNFDEIMTGLWDCGYKGYFNFEAARTLCPARDRTKFAGDSRLLRCRHRIKYNNSVVLSTTKGVIYEKR